MLSSGEFFSAVVAIVSKSNPTKDDLEFGANKAEQFWERFPINFPTENITQKMHILSYILPKYILEGSTYRLI